MIRSHWIEARALYIVNGYKDIAMDNTQIFKANIYWIYLYKISFYTLNMLKHFFLKLYYRSDG